jgi:hypothetical protein
VASQVPLPLSADIVDRRTGIAEPVEEGSGGCSLHAEAALSFVSAPFAGANLARPSLGGIGSSRHGIRKSAGFILAAV